MIAPAPIRISALVGRVAVPVLVLLALLGPLSVFAAGAVPQTKVVTTVTLIAGGRETGPLNSAIARFEQEFPSIEIQPTYTSAAALIAAVNAGASGPDLVTLGTGGAPSAGLPSVWALGGSYLADLSGRPWVKDVWQPLLPLVSVARKVYAEPLINGVGGVIYNKDLFARLGLTPPTTWSAFLALCNQIADRGVVPVEFAGADALTTRNVATILAANSVFTADPSWSAERNANKVSFAATSGWRGALGRLLEMRGARCFEPSPQTVNGATAYAVFNAGQAAMVVTNSHEALLNIAQPNPSLKFGFFPLPGDSVKTTHVLVYPVVTLAVRASSPVKQQALQFLDFVARSWQSVFIANDENSISSLDLAKGVAPPNLSLYSPFIKSHQVSINPINWANNPTSITVLSADITALLAGTKTIDQVLTDVDAAW
jgi:raffinose/stachyose/melibiose transport system substrate-binding protein